MDEDEEHRRSEARTLYHDGPVLSRKRVDVSEIEHHPSCKERCVRECDVSPRKAYQDRDVPRGCFTTAHTDVIPPPLRASAPLWEHIDDWSCVEWHREHGTEIRFYDVEVARLSPDVRTLVGLPLPLAETFVAFERADPRYSLERWTAPKGVKDLEFAAIKAVEKARGHAKAAPDVEGIAERLRTWFPDLTDIRAKGEHLVASGGIFVGVVWGLALVLFGREKDPVSEYAIGRMLPGEPLSETRAPFACPAHVLSVASHEMQGLGGGGSAWPKEDPRMAKRTWAKGDEMKVSGAHASSDRVKGEGGIHRIMDARNVARRAALTPAERAMVEVLSDCDLTREEKATRLREVEAVSRGMDLAGLVTAETARLVSMMRLMRGEAAEQYQKQIAARGPADDAHRNQALRKATCDVSDRELYARAKAAEKRVREAAERQSAAGDQMVPKRVERVKPRRHPAAPFVAYVPGDGAALACG